MYNPTIYLEEIKDPKTTKQPKPPQKKLSEVKSRNSEIHSFGESQVRSGIKTRAVKFPDLVGKNMHS